MWKYQCKKQLVYVLLGFIGGAILFGFFKYQQEYIISILKGITSDPAILKNPYIFYISGGLIVAGAVNGLGLLFYVIQRFNINYLFVLLLLLLGGVDLALMIGTAELLPCIAVYIFGWLTIPNRGVKKNNVTTVQEVERVYRLHHTYDVKYEELGKRAWKNIMMINVLYALGVGAFFLILLYVDEPVIIMLAMLLYFILFYQLTRRKNAILQPIISLLYDECNPEACATAIFALARGSKRKKTFPLPQQLAQCMIYLNDPHSAIDVLVTCDSMKNKGSFVYTYHTLMAYAYYQLGDSSIVKHHLDECAKITSNAALKGPMAAIYKQSLEAIQNKLDLMEKDFSKAETFYKTLLQASPFEFQRVDSQYYIGLVSFVQRDIEMARRAFAYVSEHGNGMYFKEKADSFLATIEALPQDEY